VSKHCNNCRHWSNLSPPPDEGKQAPEGWGHCGQLRAQSLLTSDAIWIFPPPSGVMTNQHFGCSLHEQQMQVVTRHEA
jgi:hypothetical protein